MKSDPFKQEDAYMRPLLSCLGLLVLLAQPGASQLTFGDLRVYSSPRDITNRKVNLDWFKDLMSHCDTLPTFSLLMDSVTANNGLTLYVSRTEDVGIAGLVVEKTPGHDDEQRFTLNPEGISKFPRSPSSALPPWATTQCMVLAHEVREGFNAQHPEGVDQENRMRTAMGLPTRSMNRPFRHDGHTDHVTLIGNNAEVLHFADPTTKVLRSISYLIPWP